MVVALELDDDLAAGRGTREPDRGLVHLGAGAAEPHALRARDHRLEPLGELELGARLAGEQLAAPDRVAHRLDDLRRRMAEDPGPHPEDVVHVVVPVDIEEVRARAVVEEQRHRVHARAGSCC